MDLAGNRALVFSTMNLNLHRITIAVAIAFTAMLAWMLWGIANSLGL